MKKLQSVLSVIVLALLALAVAWQLLPVYQGSAATQDEIVEFQFWRAQGLTADACSNPVNARINSTAEIQLDIVSMPTVNTTTFTLYHSNDGVTYYAGGVVASAVVTNGGVLSYSAANNHGVFTKICADVSGSDRFTVTSRGLFKP